MGELRGVEGEGGVRVSITFLESKYTPAPPQPSRATPGLLPVRTLLPACEASTSR